MHLLSTTTTGLTSLFVSAAILLLLVGVLLAVLSVVRRRMRGDDFSPPDFTLTQLRELNRQGNLTDEEFERAKALLVGKVHRDLAKEAKPSMAARPLHADLKPDEPSDR